MTAGLRMASLAFVTLLPLLMGVSSGQLYLQPSGVNQAHFTNDDFVITCVAPADSGAVRLTWEAPFGEIKTTEGRMHVEPVGEDEHSLRLVVLGVIWEDAGEYKCSAVIDGKEVERKFLLIVYRAISFAGTPSKQVATLGEDTTILCHATAEPKPVIAWQHNGSRVSPENFPRFKQVSSGMTIANVTRADEGIYTCKAIAVFSLNSQVVSFNISLRVQYPPEWKEPAMERAYSSLGSSAALTCEATAYPKPMFEWLKHDTVIETDDDYNITEERDKSILHVKVTNHSQFGNYICRASNKVGAAERTIVLEEGEKPGLPQVRIRSNQNNAIVLAISPPPYITLPIVGYRVQYKHKHEQWSEAISQDFDLNDHHVIRHLNPGTEYILRVAARNAAGLGDYSHEIDLKTGRTSPSPVVKDNDSASALVTPIFLQTILTSVLLWLRWSIP